MTKIKRRSLSLDEKHVLEHGHIRLLTRAQDIKRCDEAILQHHYLHNATLVGEHLRYGFFYKGQLLAVATWSAAALHLKAREAFIGWTHEQCRRRRSLIANNSRLLGLPEAKAYPNLLSRFMKLMLERVSRDWELKWNHPIAMVETFVDPNEYQGTAYRVSGWCRLGKTSGWKRDAEDFYEKHDAPKQVWVRELVKKAAVQLRAPEMPAAWAKVEESVPARCTQKVGEIQSLMDRIQSEPGLEFRRAQSLAYPVAGMLCLIVMACAQGVVRGPQDLADYAATLSQGQLRALGFRRERNGRKRIRFPKKTVFTRVLHAVSDDVIERVLLSWQNHLLGSPQDRLVILDGKELRHAGVELVNAVDSQGRFLGSIRTKVGSTEVPAARQWLSQQDLNGKVVLSDAAHTVVETSRQILYELGGDYLQIVKGNQPTVFKNLESLFAKQAFSPSTHEGDARVEARAQSEAIGDSLPGLHGSDAESGGISRSADGG